MTVLFNPYLSFDDNARQVMEFYHSVFGGKLEISTFGEFGMSDDPAEKDKVMHSQLTADLGFVLMASDTPKAMGFQPGAGYSLSFSGDDDVTLRKLWADLADGGEITLPLDQAPWGDVFGQVKDRFGVSWMVSIATPAAAE
ncbi:PhnB protein [Conyzicola lurida]|uniref:PhnB protein n=1 Tax=Conyzicola lurida TaxID=1172621 RepID=A0A841AM82_9MICO|nr:VOC family protein [Conyzicola lurida]MBB5842625.1 PhnB protein [Conyzicola lurida]